jgi:type I restriction enzyme M protein
MTNGDLRNKIDRLWTEFWTGGITNPLTVIEQITYLFFCRMLDEAETNREKAAQRTGKPLKVLWFGKDQQELRWSSFRHKSGEELLALVRDKVFPFLRSLDHPREINGDNEGARIGLGALMKDAQLLIVKPGLLSSAISAIDDMEMSSTDAKGDLYEYLLSKLSTAGINGQFRTPRHILETMVELVDPKPTETIGDPACGTAGFLVKTMEYLRRTHTSPDMVYEGANGKPVYIGDQLTPYQDHINNRMFRGFDFDLTMLRLSAMNMMLHGVTGRCIFYQDSLSESFKQNYPTESSGYFDVIMANPPFKGNLDTDDIAQELTRKVKSTKTELLFLVRMLGMLTLGGRCAVIVPDGVLFGSSKAHLALRQLLVDENQLDGVISLPSGVFKPYAGVSTAILLFTKGGKTGDVFFFDVKADGYSLDDKRNKIEADDLPELLRRWKARDAKKDTDRSAQAFFVPAVEIREQKYDLSLNRYKKQAYVPEEYDPPLVILERMEKLEEEIMAGLRELRGMLG